MQVFAHPVVYQCDYLMSSSCRHKKKVHYYAIPTVTKSVTTSLSSAASIGCKHGTARVLLLFRCYNETDGRTDRRTPDSCIVCEQCWQAVNLWRDIVLMSYAGGCFLVWFTAGELCRCVMCVRRKFCSCLLTFPEEKQSKSFSSLFGHLTAGTSCWVTFSADICLRICIAHITRIFWFSAGAYNFLDNILR